MGSGGTIRQGALGWAFVTCLIAVLVGLIGYTVGASDKEESQAQAAPATPELIPLTTAYRSGRSEGFRRGRLGAYRDGRLDGLKEGRRAERRLLGRRVPRIRRAGAVEALGSLDPDSWFLVAHTPERPRARRAGAARVGPALRALPRRQRRLLRQVAGSIVEVKPSTLGVSTFCSRPSIGS